MSSKGDLSLNLCERQVFEGVFRGAAMPEYGVRDPVSNMISFIIYAMSMLLIVIIYS